MAGIGIDIFDIKVFTGGVFPRRAKVAFGNVNAGNGKTPAGKFGAYPAKTAAQIKRARRAAFPAVPVQVETCQPGYAVGHLRHFRPMGAVKHNRGVFFPKIRIEKPFPLILSHTGIILKI